MGQGRDPQLYPEETVDRLEAEALGDRRDGGRDEDEPADEVPGTDREPVYDQDKDVEDLPGGAGEPGGSTSEPSG